MTFIFDFSSLIIYLLVCYGSLPFSDNNNNDNNNNDVNDNNNNSSINIA